MECNVRAEGGKAAHVVQIQIRTKRNGCECFSCSFLSRCGAGLGALAVG